VFPTGADTATLSAFEVADINMDQQDDIVYALKYPGAGQAGRNVIYGAVGITWSTATATALSPANENGVPVHKMELADVNNDRVLDQVYALETGGTKVVLGEAALNPAIMTDATTVNANLGAEVDAMVSDMVTKNAWKQSDGSTITDVAIVTSTTHTAEESTNYPITTNVAAAAAPDATHDQCGPAGSNVVPVTTSFFVEFPTVPCDDMPHCIISGPLERIDHSVGVPNDVTAGACSYKISSIHKVTYVTPIPPPSPPPPDIVVDHWVCKHGKCPTADDEERQHTILYHGIDQHMHFNLGYVDLTHISHLDYYHTV
jgi:hypothetical protein